MGAGFSDKIPAHTVTMACISSNQAMTSGMKRKEQKVLYVSSCMLAIIVVKNVMAFYLFGKFGYVVLNFSCRNSVA